MGKSRFSRAGGDPVQELMPPARENKNPKKKFQNIPKPNPRSGHPAGYGRGTAATVRSGRGAAATAGSGRGEGGAASGRLLGRR